MAFIRRKVANNEVVPVASSKKERQPTPHDELVARAARWLKNTCGCSAVLAEIRSFTASGECPDAVGWRSNYSILVECKVSRGDFLADKDKPFRKQPEKGVGVYRFFMCPPGVIEVEDLPDGWGLLYVKGRQVKRVAGPTGNIWESPSNAGFAHKRSQDSEIAMLVSALRRQGA